MFNRKAKKERRIAIERQKKLFRLKLSEFRQKALSTGRTLRETFVEHHYFLQSRQATNIITADHVGRGEKTRALEIEEIHKREDKAESVFEEALDEFIQEVGEVERAKAEEKTIVKRKESGENDLPTS